MEVLNLGFRIDVVKGPFEVLLFWCEVEVRKKLEV